MHRREIGDAEASSPTGRAGIAVGLWRRRHVSAVLAAFYFSIVPTILTSGLTSGITPILPARVAAIIAARYEHVASRDHLNFNALCRNGHDPLSLEPVGDWLGRAIER